MKIPSLILASLAMLLFVLAAGGALAQNTKPISFGVIGMGGGAFEALKSYEEELNVRLIHVKPDKFMQDPLPDLSEFDVVITSFASGDQKDQYKLSFAAALKKNPDLKTFCVGPPAICGIWGEWIGRENIKHDPQMAGYYGLSKQSMKDMLLYTLITYFDRPGKVDPPNAEKAVKIYHPEYGDMKNVGDFLRLAEKDGWNIENTPRVALGTWRHHRVFHQPKVVDALIAELRKRGILALCLIADAKGFTKRLEEFEPDLVVMTSHTREPAAFWEKLDVPRIHALWFTDESIDEWRKSVNTGMRKSSIQHQIVSAELKGATEFLTAGGTEFGGDSGEEIIPIPDRIRRIGGRVQSWIELAHKKNSDKKIPIIYYDSEADKSGLMMGPAHCMNAPRSMVKFLEAMKQDGYAIPKTPADADELLEWASDHGRQMGMGEAGTLDKLATSGKAVLIHEEKYRAWFEEKVPQHQRDEVKKYWGDAPGTLMTWERGGKKYIVIPRINLGNVILMPQPLKGETLIASTKFKDIKASLLPPPHNYLATYFWLQEQFGADAVVHFGSHGTEWLFPGKQAALSSSDWSDILLGNMPNVNPWLSSNTAEHTPCRRRAMAVTIDFLPPPLTEAGLSDELLNLRSDIIKWKGMEEGALKKKFAASISEQATACRLNEELHFTTPTRQNLSTGNIKKISKYLHDLQNEFIPTGMHILGQRPSDELLIPYLAHCMGKRFQNAAREIFDIPTGTPSEESYLNQKGEEIIRLMLLQGFTPMEATKAAGAKLPGEKLPEAVQESLKMVAEMSAGLEDTNQEIDNVLKALEGKFIPPGPSGSPERNPGVIPTGRNMFVLNPEELPSRTSWELAVKLIDDYLAGVLAKKDAYPRKVGFSLVPYATYSDYGIIESQILYLMGVRPVWDTKNRVRNVELIPAAELRRPRIDVFLSARSVYRDELPSLMKLLDKAIRMAARAKEKNNYVYDHSEAMRKKLEQGGFAPAKAQALSTARMYGAEPEEIIDSHNWFFYLTERSGEWENRQDLLDVYLSHSKHVYTQGMWGVDSPEAFDEAIQGTELILRSWYDNRDFVLSNKFAWWVDGTLSLAIKHITGKEPDFLFVDVRNADNASLVDSADAVQKDFRIRLTNPKWIKGMMKEGYAGANIIAKNVDNLMGWEIMRDQSISDSNWEQVADIYIRDSKNLRIREWYDEQNPHAFQKLSVTMLETIRKQFWKADEARILEIAEAYSRSVAEHGKGGGTREGGNEKLKEFVEKTLSAPGTQELNDLLEEFRQKSAEMEIPDDASAKNEPIEGNKLEKQEEKAKQKPLMNGKFVAVLALIALIIFVIGFRFRGTAKIKGRKGKF